MPQMVNRRSVPLSSLQVAKRLRPINYAYPIWDETAVIEALVRQHELLDLPVPKFVTLDSLECLRDKLQPQMISIYSDAIHRLTASALRAAEENWPRHRPRVKRSLVIRVLQPEARHSILMEAGFSEQLRRLRVKDISDDIFRTIEALERTLRTDDLLQLIRVGMLHVRACANGLGYYAATENGFYLVPLPRMAFQDNQLHREDGLAVRWPGGDGYFFLRGQSFTKDQHWRLMNKEFSPAHLMDISDADKRAIALAYLKPDVLIQALEAELMHTGQKGTRLYRTRLFPGIWHEATYFMLMDDASTDRQFIEWVPHDVGRAHHAELCQAHAFGITLEQWLSITSEG